MAQPVYEVRVGRHSRQYDTIKNEIFDAFSNESQQKLTMTRGEVGWTGYGGVWCGGVKRVGRGGVVCRRVWWGGVEWCRCDGVWWKEGVLGLRWWH